jgi:hypothetical protein
MAEILEFVGDVALELIGSFLFERSSGDSELSGDDISSSEKNG